MALQPHFSTGTPTELLEAIRRSSLQCALRGELVQTAFVMRRTVTGLRVRGSSPGGRPPGSAPRGGRGAARANSATAVSSPAAASASSPSPSEEVVRQLARDDDNDDDIDALDMLSGLLSPERERELFINSALPPGYGPYTSNAPSRQIRLLQQLIAKREKDAVSPPLT
jgi:hypothetical protein